MLRSNFCVFIKKGGADLKGFGDSPQQGFFIFLRQQKSKKLCECGNTCVACYSMAPPWNVVKLHRQLL